MLVQSLDAGPAPSAEERFPRALGHASNDPLPRGLVLSNERTITLWAYAAEPAAIYASPHVHAQRVSRLRWCTEDGFREVYLLLRLHRDRAGREWVKLRMPMRPNGQVGWVRREAIGSFQSTPDLLVLDRRRLRLKFFTDGRLRWSASAGVGASGTPTPSGHYWIRERFKLFDPSSGYWPYVFGTAAYTAQSDGADRGVVMIHGSQLEADAIPGCSSPGCILVQLADDLWLGTHLGLGTPLRVL